jgi:hypothetical protein
MSFNASFYAEIPFSHLARKQKAFYLHFTHFDLGGTGSQ